MTPNKFTLSDYEKLGIPDMTTLGVVGSLTAFRNPKVWEEFDLDVYLPSKKMNLQRPVVWTEQQQTKYVEHFLTMRPGLYGFAHFPSSSNSGDPKSIRIIDGKQRLVSLYNFVNDKIKIFDCYFSEFSKDAINRMFFQPTEFIVVRADLSDDDLVKLFYYLNEGGTKQDKKHIDLLLGDL